MPELNAPASLANEPNVERVTHNNSDRAGRYAARGQQANPQVMEGSRVRQMVNDIERSQATHNPAPVLRNPEVAIEKVDGSNQRPADRSLETPDVAISPVELSRNPPTDRGQAQERENPAELADTPVISSVAESNRYAPRAKANTSPELEAIASAPPVQIDQDKLRKINAVGQKIADAQSLVPDSGFRPVSDDLMSGMIKSNFSKVVKDIDGSFRKGHYREVATKIATQMIKNAPPGSDLTWTVTLKTDAELRETIAQGMGLIKGKHAGKSYEQLPENKQKLVDAILAGMKAGLPTDMRVKHEALKNTLGNTSGVTPEAVNSRTSLMDAIRQPTQLQPSAEKLAALDARAHKGIDVASQKIESDAKALKEQTKYGMTVPKAVSTEVSRPEMESIVASVPSKKIYTSEEIRNAQQLVVDGINAFPEADKLMWTLGLKPPSEIERDVSALLFPGVQNSALTDSQKLLLTSVADTMLKTSLKKLAESSTDTVTKKSRSGDPEIVSLNGKTYTQVKQLGEGSFGKAFLFQAEDGHQVVLKRFKQDPNQSAEKWFGNMQAEIRTHRYAMGPEGEGHENVLKLHGSIFQRDAATGLGEFHTVTEVAGGGEMLDVSNSLNEQLSSRSISTTSHQLLKRFMLAESMKGMLYVQRDRQMLHLDIKPENIFMTKDGDVKVADFGLSAVTSGFNENTRRGAGTSGYMSPEVAQKFDERLDKQDQSKNNVNYKSDTWSLGILSRQLMTGNIDLPHRHNDGITDAVDFGADTSNRVYTKGDDERRVGQYERVTTQSLGAYEQVINSMVHPDPDKRPTLEAISQHELFNDPALANPRVKDILKELMAIKSEETDYGNFYSAEDQAKMAKLNEELEDIAKHSM